MKILIINGPNLNMTGRREKEIYGTKALDEMMNDLRAFAESLGIVLDHIQSNYEGKLIDELQTAGDKYDGVLLNAGALTHYSYSLRDAILCCTVPVAEVHMSNILEREDFRKTDVIEDVCAFRIMGLGEESYSEALKMMKDMLDK